MTTLDEHAAQIRAAGLCSMCEGTKRSPFGGPCRSCRGAGTAQAETDVVLDSIEAELASND